MADNSDPPDEDENLEVRVIKEEQNDEVGSGKLLTFQKADSWRDFSGSR